MASMKAALRLQQEQGENSSEGKRDPQSGYLGFPRGHHWNGLSQYPDWLELWPQEGMRLAWPHPKPRRPESKVTKKPVETVCGMCRHCQSHCDKMGYSLTHMIITYTMSTQKKPGLNDRTHSPTGSGQFPWEEWAELSSPGAASYQHLVCT